MRSKNKSRRKSVLKFLTKKRIH